MTHTLGPWAVHRDEPLEVVPSDHASRPLGGAEDDAYDLAHYAQTICNLYSTDRHRGIDEARANARLIAAAPELLEALLKLTMMARTSGGTLGPDKALMEACEVAEAAINKAAVAVK